MPLSRTLYGSILTTLALCACAPQPARENVPTIPDGSSSSRIVEAQGRLEGKISAEEAVVIVRRLPEVQEWLASPYDEPLCAERDVVAEDVPVDGVFRVALMMICTNHNSVGARFTVDAETGEVKPLEE